jgi:arylsulfatase A-like enzyme
MGHGFGRRSVAGKRYGSGVRLALVRLHPAVRGFPAVALANDPAPAGATLFRTCDQAVTELSRGPDTLPNEVANLAIRDAVFRGAGLGAATWSAYAATELVFASLLFGFTRPYAVFTSWHWQLTLLLLAGFLAAGLLLGTIAGLAVFFLGKTGILQENSSTVLESAAALTLVAAYIANTLSSFNSSAGGVPVSIAALCFGALLLTEMRSSKWSGRFGLLTNPWVISVVLLGVEQEWDLRNMGLARQLGGRVQLGEALLAGMLILALAASLFVGRRLRPRISGSRWALATLALLAVLSLSSAALAFWHTRTVQAAPQRAAGNAAGKPNVILIVMDTVRADHLSLYGYGLETTPNLKVLAQDAAVYTQAQSAADITLTSHASLFTGMYPSWHGAYCRPPEAAYGRELSKQWPTLAEILRGGGYSTLGVAANLYLRSDFGLDRGFQEFRIPRPVPVLADENRYQLRRSLRRVLNLVTDTAQFDRLFSRGEDINESFFAALDVHRQGNQPFFGFLNYMDAHFPYIPPAPYDHMFPGKRSAIPQDDLESAQQTISAGAPAPSFYRPYCVSQYDGGIAYLDAQIGQMVAGLKQRNLYDDTMIVVTSDHGEAFGERHRVEHGNSPYQNLLHVALLIKYPGVKSARVKYPGAARTGVVADAVSLVDVAPTVLSVAGFSVPPAMQGQSLLDAGAAGGREIFSETFPCPVMHAPECPGCTARAVVSWPFKYIGFSNGTRELFNLEADPDEQRNLAGVANRDAARMGGRLSAWVKSLPAQSRQKVALTVEEMRRLKSLGYVGGR